MWQLLIHESTTTFRSQIVSQLSGQQRIKENHQSDQKRMSIMASYGVRFRRCAWYNMHPLS